MTRILIRAGRDPFVPVGGEATLTQDVFNTNVGNYLFSHSVQRALMVPGTEIVPDSTLAEPRPATAEAVARVNEEFDAYVVPLANAFRPDFARRLANLTSLIERLTIPVVVVGVGAQANLSRDLESLAEVRSVTKAFVSAVLRRSASIGVRGQFTADFLQDLGFPESAVDIIGCPSLFLHGPNFRLTSPTTALATDAEIALNVTDGVPGLPEFVERLVAERSGVTYVGQDKHDLRLMLWGEEPQPPRDRRLPFHAGHPLYVADRVRFPLDVTTWLDLLAGVDFTVGTRFHGNVAATLADTPAVLLAHDSRTVELAEFHALPHVPMSELPSDATAASLFQRYDPSAFNEAYPAGFANYLTFLDRNGLAHIHTPGNDSGEFDDRLAAVAFPPPVAPLNSSATDEVAARLRWLRDGQAFDSGVQLQAYHQPFPVSPPKERSDPHTRSHRNAQAKIVRLETKLERARGRLDGNREKIQGQRRRLDKQGERLRRHTERLEELETRVRELESRGFLRRLRRRLRGGS